MSYILNILELPDWETLQSEAAKFGFTERRQDIHSQRTTQDALQTIHSTPSNCLYKGFSRLLSFFPLFPCDALSFLMYPCLCLAFLGKDFYIV